jgi:hypothetical protein
MHAENPAPDLPPYSLDVQALDLGSGTKSVGLELIETESREPLAGQEAAQIWAASFPALAAKEHYAVDFFSHLGRVREFCAAHNIDFREASGRCLVVSQPSVEILRQLILRFERETFGFRAGAATQGEDPILEGELSKRGLDAYEGAYRRYTFCAICEASEGWVTVLSETLWPSEIIRRVRPALQPFDVYIAQPQ